MFAVCDPRPGHTTKRASRAIIGIIRSGWSRWNTCMAMFSRFPIPRTSEGRQGTGHPRFLIPPIPRQCNSEYRGLRGPFPPGSIGDGCSHPGLEPLRSLRTRSRRPPSGDGARWSALLAGARSCASTAGERPCLATPMPRRCPLFPRLGGELFRSYPGPP